MSRYFDHRSSRWDETQDAPLCDYCHGLGTVKRDGKPLPCIPCQGTGFSGGREP